MNKLILFIALLTTACSGHITWNGQSMNGVYLPTDYQHAKPIPVSLCPRLSNLSETYFDQGHRKRDWPVEVHQALTPIFIGGDHRLEYVSSHLEAVPLIDSMDVTASYHLSVKLDGEPITGEGYGQSGINYNEAVMGAVERAVYEIYRKAQARIH